MTPRHPRQTNTAVHSTRTVGRRDEGAPTFSSDRVRQLVGGDVVPLVSRSRDGGPIRRVSEREDANGLRAEKTRGPPFHFDTARRANAILPADTSVKALAETDPGRHAPDFRRQPTTQRNGCPAGRLRVRLSGDSSGAYRGSFFSWGVSFPRRLLDQREDRAVRPAGMVR